MSGSRFGPSKNGPYEPISGLMGSLIDVWINGLKAWQEMAGRASPDGDDGATPFDAVIRPVADIAASLGVPVLDAASEAGQATASQLADMSPAIAQSGLAATTSAFRYSSGLAELLMRYHLALIQATADRASGRAAASPAECRVLADELRAFLRQVGDTALIEARRLQQELEVIGESIARTASETTPTTDQWPRRRAYRVKM